MKNVIRKIEALIFASSQPISYKKIANIVDVSYDEVKTHIKELEAEYSASESAIELVEINNSVQFVVKDSYSDVVDKLYNTDSKRLLTSSELEVLSIIAYKQPVTRREINNIRGINSARVVNNLIDLSLVKISGKKDAPGLPVLYATTETFLLKFGLRSLKELPKIDETPSDINNLFKK